MISADLQAHAAQVIGNVYETYAKVPYMRALLDEADALTDVRGIPALARKVAPGRFLAQEKEDLDDYFSCTCVRIRAGLVTCTSCGSLVCGCPNV
jgi:hypothetical protein